jgi:hypothetical protein
MAIGINMQEAVEAIYEAWFSLPNIGYRFPIKTKAL